MGGGNGEGIGNFRVLGAWELGPAVTPAPHPPQTFPDLLQPLLFYAPVVCIHSPRTNVSELATNGSRKRDHIYSPMIGMSKKRTTLTHALISTRSRTRFVSGLLATPTLWVPVLPSASPAGKDINGRRFRRFRASSSHAERREEEETRIFEGIGSDLFCLPAGFYWQSCSANCRSGARESTWNQMHARRSTNQYMGVGPTDSWAVIGGIRWTAFFDFDMSRWIDVGVN
ncbi:hypothetical protein GW17_00021151 [Ensete ventricosum]|nr:hypothetical protein GW17_00021151 [Ensete ventricosum]